MSRGFFRRENEIERTLRGARPHASDELLDQLVSRAKAVPVRAPRRLGMRLAGAAGVTALMVAGLAATGGISYAASTVDHVVAQVTHHSTFMGARMAVSVKKTSASTSQYTTQGGTQSSSTVGVFIPPTLISANGVADRQHVLQDFGALIGLHPAKSGLGSLSGLTGHILSQSSTFTASTGITQYTTLIGAVDTKANTVSFQTQTTTFTGGTSTTAATATVSMSGQTYGDLFSSASVGGKGATSIVVDPKPQVTTLGGTPAYGVTLQFNDSAGNPVTVGDLAQPISLTIPKPAGGFPTSGGSGTFVPAFSTDGGKTFQAIQGPLTSPPNLPAGQQTGWYKDSSGNMVIVTRHATIFAVLAAVNLGVSESGRKLKKAGSGLFGDPLLMHPGPAVVKQIGKKVAVYPFRTLKGDAVKFDFFVDEQVSAYVQLFKGSKLIPMDLHGTQIRGGTISKERTIKTLHIAVLRPGTLPIRLHVPASQLKSGAKYRIRVSAIDFDGNKTVRYIPFTG